MGSHPGGTGLTARLLALAGSLPGKRALDLGAGEGEAAEYMRSRGFDVAAVDQNPGGPGVKKGDMRSLSYADESFDLCLAECSLSVCGDGRAALRESERVLKRQGVLLVSDVYFQKPDAPALSMGAPLTRQRWEEVFRNAGFALETWEDVTELWRQFFLESLWNGNADAACADFFRRAGKAGCGYFLARLVKGEGYGFV